MITEDKITEFFRIAYDFYKIFDAQMAKCALKAIKFTLIYHQFIVPISDKSHISVLKIYISFRYPLPIIPNSCMLGSSPKQTKNMQI